MPCDKGLVIRSRMTFKKTTLTDKRTLMKALREIWSFPNEIVERDEDIVITGVHGGIAVTLKKTSDGYEVQTTESNLRVMDRRYEYGFVPALKVAYNTRAMRDLARSLREDVGVETVDDRIRVTVGR